MCVNYLKARQRLVYIPSQQRQMHGGVGEEEDTSNPIKSNPSGLPELLSFPHRAPFMLNNSKFMT